MLETRCPYPLYREEVIKTATLGKLFSTVTAEHGVWRELAETERRLTEQERIETALFLAESEAVALLPPDADVIVKAAWTEETDGALYGVCRITTEESIGIQREIMHGANDGTGQD